MLVKLRGYGVKIDEWTHRLEILNLPSLYFEDSNYNICVRSIIVDCDYGYEIPSPQHWSLTSTMVDMTSLNPRQEIVSFVSTRGLSLINYEPKIKQEYKIQLTELQSSVFNLVTLKKDVNFEINFIEILLEFTRYARI